MDTLPTELIVYLAGFLPEKDRLRLWNVSKLLYAIITASSALAASTLFLPRRFVTTDDIRKHIASAPAFRGFSTCILDPKVAESFCQISTYNLLQVLSDCTSLNNINFGGIWGERYGRLIESSVPQLASVTAVNLSGDYFKRTIDQDLRDLFPNLRKLDISRRKFFVFDFPCFSLFRNLRELDLRGPFSVDWQQGVCDTVSEHNPTIRIVLSGRWAPQICNMWIRWLARTNFIQQYPDFRIVLVCAVYDGGNYAAPHITNVKWFDFWTSA